jgi:hypothetical protein
MGGRTRDNVNHLSHSQLSTARPHLEYVAAAALPQAADQRLVVGHLTQHLGPPPDQNHAACCTTASGFLPLVFLAVCRRGLGGRRQRLAGGGRFHECEFTGQGPETKLI